MSNSTAWQIYIMLLKNWSAANKRHTSVRDKAKTAKSGGEYLTWLFYTLLSGVTGILLAATDCMAESWWEKHSSELLGTPAAQENPDTSAVTPPVEIQPAPEKTDMPPVQTASEMPAVSDVTEIRLDLSALRAAEAEAVKFPTPLIPKISVERASFAQLKQFREHSIQVSDSLYAMKKALLPGYTDVKNYIRRAASEEDSFCISQQDLELLTDIDKRYHAVLGKFYEEIQRWNRQTADIKDRIRKFTAEEAV